MSDSSLKRPGLAREPKTTTRSARERPAAEPPGAAGGLQGAEHHDIADGSLSHLLQQRHHGENMAIRPRAVKSSSQQGTRPGVWTFCTPTACGQISPGQARNSAALGKPMRNLNPPCKGGGISFSPKGNAHRMPSHSASTTLGVLLKSDLRPCRAQEPRRPVFPGRRSACPGLYSATPSGLEQGGFSLIIPVPEE